MFCRIVAQAPSTIYQFEDERIFEFTDGDVYALSDGNVMAIHMLRTPNEDRGFDQIAIHEFDTCGLVNQNVIRIEPLFGISYISDFHERGDSIFLIGQGGSTPGEHSYSEGFIMVLHRRTLAGRYHYFRSRQGTSIFNIDFLPRGGIVAFGVSQSTMAQPSQYFTFFLDEDYKMTSARRFLGSGSFSGNVTTIDDERFLIRSSQNLFMMDDSFNVLWNKTFDRPVSGERSIVETDGVVLLINGWYDDTELQVLKIDLEGNILWSSPRLNNKLGLDNNVRLLSAHEGGYYVIQQSYEFEQYEGDIEITRLLSGGVISNQFAIGTPKNEERFEWMREAAVVNDDVYVMMRTINGALKLYRLAANSVDCGYTEFNYANSDSYNWFYDENHIPMAQLTFEMGVYSVTASPLDLPIPDVCEKPYAEYNLLPDDTVLCEGYTINIDLSIIDEAVFWADGFGTGINENAKYRVIDKPGTYAYGYGSCQTELAETVHIEQEDCRCKVFIPSVFSPNNDGINDRFDIYSPCEIREIASIKIFDRWGSRVFAKSEGSISWDGTVLGQPCPTGMYVYEVIYKDVGLPIPNHVSVKGDVFLCR